MKDLKDKSVLVTGGASGIGYATAELLLELGSNVTIVDVDEATGTQALDALKGRETGSAQFVRADVTSESDVRAAVEAAVKKFGRLDAAVNSAGISPRIKIIHELSTEEWNRCNALNLTGMYFCVRYQIEAMLQTGGGAIVAISSTASVKSPPRSVEYSASKAGVNALVRTVALDYAAKGIRINAIMPGPILTPMHLAIRKQNNLSTTDFEDMKNKYPMQRAGLPREVANGAVWLISDAASYVTGASLPIDGGVSAG